MTREELEYALTFWDDYRGQWLDVLKVAARKQLALMPEKCGDDRHVGYEGEYVICPICHGTGKVYPPETVEKIVDAIRINQWGDIPAKERELKAYRSDAVAVLDALGEA